MRDGLNFNRLRDERGKEREERKGKRSGLRGGRGNMRAEKRIKTGR